MKKLSVVLLSSFVPCLVLLFTSSCSGSGSGGGPTPNTIGVASGAAVDSSGNVYFAGYTGTSSGQLPCCWKNGALTSTLDISGYSYFGTAQMFLDSSGDLYVMGYVGTSSSTFTPCYWKNGVLNLLSLGTGNTYGAASGAAVDGSGNFASRDTQEPPVHPTCPVIGESEER